MQIIKSKPGVKRGPLIVYDDIDPVEYDEKPVEKVIAVFDTETDPFKEGRIVRPFTCHFHIPHLGFHKHFWGRDCVKQFFKWLAKVTGKGGEFEDFEFVILVHNGGNFDFYFFIDLLDDGHSPFIINGRLVRVMAQGQEFRDSYAMIPVPLSDYDKIKFDYDKMELWEVYCLTTRRHMTCREFFKDEILEYQKYDCVALGELVVAWYDMFGNRLTMASVALPMLRSHHGFEQMDERTDAELRPYYFGGRNQCFATGEIRGALKLFDIKSSYPRVMGQYQHPISDTPRYEAVISDRTAFAYIRAWSLGALPIRTPDGGLSFPIGTYDFFACIHEIRAGLATKTLQIKKVYSSVYFDQSANFGEFIDRFFGLRMEASARGDKINTLFYKLVMNSSYGKFAQDPRKYENNLFNPDAPPTPVFCGECYQRVRNYEPKIPCETCDTEFSSPYGWRPKISKSGVSLYTSPQRLRGSSFYNVATAASITSGARANLLYGINAAVRPIYCDTDSLLCEQLFPNDHIILGKELGNWDLEAEADTAYIGGKKLYALYKDGAEVKKASKGVKLSADQIRRICQGDVIEYAHPVPKFSLEANPSMDFIDEESERKMWTKRNIRMTG